MAWTRDQMAERAAKELRDGFYVNLGIGIPTLVSNYIPDGMTVQLQSENGMLGFGPFPYEGDEDPDLINAGKQTVTELPTTSFFSSADSFAMIRGGHVDIALLGAMQVAENGDLANWDMRVPDKGPLVGGAMDLAVGARQTWVMMDLLTRQGESKVVARCSYPLTGIACVKRIYTDLCTLACTPEGLRLIDKVEGLEHAELERIVAQRNLESVVRFVDHESDMAAAYMLADVAVSASTDPEAFGRVTAEVAGLDLRDLPLALDDVVRDLLAAVSR